MILEEGSVVDTTPQTIVVVGGLSSSLINFRGEFLRGLISRGHRVIASSGVDEGSDDVADQLLSLGVEYFPVPLSRGGLNPLTDFKTFRAICELLRVHRPDVVIAYTAKPVVYTGLASQTLRSGAFFPLITGLGYAFTDGAGLKRRLVRWVVSALYKASLLSAKTVIFQNPDDRAVFIENGLVRPRCDLALVNGSGVSLNDFPATELPDQPVFLMLARLVADKGVREYCEAARIVMRRFPHAVFRLAGGFDPNPSSVGRNELQSWEDEGVIEYLGDLRTVQPALAACRFYVLPSYREGTPRSILEAMAMGRPCITTDVPGCRETVVDGENGYLVKPRDVESLAEAMITMVKLPDEQVATMAARSVEIARAKFDVRAVNNTLFRITSS
jgi:glycosyltransferase involved in cell wall biosynthesis